MSQGAQTKNGDTGAGHLDHVLILKYVTEKALIDEVLLVEDHLATCDACVNRVRSYDALRANLDAILAGWTHEQHRELALSGLESPPMASSRAAVDPVVPFLESDGPIEVTPELPPVVEGVESDLPASDEIDNLVSFNPWLKVISWAAVAAAACVAVVIYWQGQPPEEGQRLFRDTSGPVTVADGNVIEFEAPIEIDDSLRRAIGQFAVSGQVYIRPGLATRISALDTSVVYLGVDDDGPEAPELLFPVAETVRYDHLQLRWNPADGSESQRVIVVSDEGDEWSGKAPGDASSIVVSMKRLKPGMSYTWQVETTTGSDWILSEPARFHVLSEEQTLRVLELETGLRESALALGYVYAIHGLREEALGQLERIERLNPDNPRVDEMVRSVKETLFGGGDE